MSWQTAAHGGQTAVGWPQGDHPPATAQKAAVSRPVFMPRSKTSGAPAGGVCQWLCAPILRGVDSIALYSEKHETKAGVPVRIG